MGLAYGTSDRGACHLRATFYKPELAGLVDPEEIEGKAKIFAEWEDRLTIFDTLILCRFYRDLYQWEQLTTILKGVTGLDLDAEAMRRIAVSSRCWASGGFSRYASGSGSGCTRLMLSIFR